jgi:hypothetical protein
VTTPRPPFDLGPIPAGLRIRTVDEAEVLAPLDRIFALAADVERWPEHLGHYRYVRFHERASDGGGIVAMSANRPFAGGMLNWPTWWTSEMAVHPPPTGAKPGGARALRDAAPAIRFRHIRGITTGMEVEWRFEAILAGTRVRIIHEWNGPAWPVIGRLAARWVIGPVFIHGIASRTLAGLARVAERDGTSGDAKGRATRVGGESRT